MKRHVGTRPRMTPEERQGSREARGPDLLPCSTGCSRAILVRGAARPASWTCEYCQRKVPRAVPRARLMLRAGGPEMKGGNKGARRKAAARGRANRVVRASIRGTVDQTIRRLQDRQHGGPQGR